MNDGTPPALGCSGSDAAPPARRSNPVTTGPRRRTRIGAAAAAAAIAAAAAVILTGLCRPVLSKGMSMAPTFTSRELLLVTAVAAAELEPGDIAVVTHPDGQRIVHRVMNVDPLPGAGTATIISQGDNNVFADPPVTVRRAQRVIAHLPMVWAAAITGAGWAAVAVSAAASAKRRSARRAAPTRRSQ